MYLVFRGDLKLSKGKVAAQAGHAVQLCLRAIERSKNPLAQALLTEWERGSYPKIALKVRDERAWDLLKGLLNATRVSGLEFYGGLDGIEPIYAVVVDEGRTEIPAGTETCLALMPLPRPTAHTYVGDLPLY